MSQASYRVDEQHLREIAIGRIGVFIGAVGGMLTAQIDGPLRYSALAFALLLAVVSFVRFHRAYRSNR